MITPDPNCPVCGRPYTHEELQCPNCSWRLRAEHRLGEPTSKQEAELADKLERARQVWQERQRKVAMPREQTKSDEVFQVSNSRATGGGTRPEFPDTDSKGENMASPDLVLINQQIGTRDFLPGEFDTKTFADVAKWLKEKYPEQILERLREAGAEQNLDRTVFKFEHVDAAGHLVPIELSDPVGSIKKLSSQVNWIAEPLGG